MESQRRKRLFLLGDSSKSHEEKIYELDLTGRVAAFWVGRIKAFLEDGTQ